ncbi:hypothetical protein ABZ894_30900 [Nocardia beijingensis]|uniref:hypothetical protein n=1 Tax=Nocardia beijingensis TaxID=95162 RepID=UPI0033DBD962
MIEAVGHDNARTTLHYYADLINDDLDDVAARSWPRPRFPQLRTRSGPEVSDAEQAAGLRVDIQFRSSSDWLDQMIDNCREFTVTPTDVSQLRY